MGTSSQVPAASEPHREMSSNASQGPRKLYQAPEKPQNHDKLGNGERQQPRVSPAWEQLLRSHVSSAEERLRRDAGCRGARRGGGLVPARCVPLPERCLAGTPAGSPVPADGRRGNGLISHFLCIVHLNNNKKAIGLKRAGITRRSGDVSMCKQLIKIETQDTSTDANYLGWQIKESNFPSERFIPCLAEGADCRSEGWQGAAVGQPGGTRWPPPHSRPGAGPCVPVLRPRLSLHIQGVPPAQLGDRWRARACKTPGKGSAWGRGASSLSPCLPPGTGMLSTQAEGHQGLRPCRRRDLEGCFGRGIWRRRADRGQDRGLLAGGSWEGHAASST